MGTKKYQLPKEFATKWVEALRSGEYPKGRLTLRDEDGYCCLGVACAMYGYTDLFGQQYLGNAKEVKHGIYNESVLPVLAILPKEIQGGRNNDLVDELTTLNDAEDDFEPVAEWIEENVEFI